MGRHRLCYCFGRSPATQTLQAPTADKPPSTTAGKEGLRTPDRAQALPEESTPAPRLPEKSTPAPRPSLSQQVDQIFKESLLSLVSSNATVVVLKSSIAGDESLTEAALPPPPPRMQRTCTLNIDKLESMKTKPTKVDEPQIIIDETQMPSETAENDSPVISRKGRHARLKCVRLHETYSSWSYGSTASEPCSYSPTMGDLPEHRRAGSLVLTSGSGDRKSLGSRFSTSSRRSRPSVSQRWSWTSSRSTVLARRPAGGSSDKMLHCHSGD